MSLPAALFIFRWLVRDTFRQSKASGVCWLMLGMTGLCVALCLSAEVTGDSPLRAPGEERPEFLPRADVARASAAAADVVPCGWSVSAGGWRLPAAVFSPEYRQVASALREGVPLARGELRLAFGAVVVQTGRDREHTVRWLQLNLAGWVADAAGLLLALVWTAGFLPSFLRTQAVEVLLAKPLPRWALLAGKYLAVLTFVAFQAGVFVVGTWLALGVRTGVWEAAYLLCVPLLVIHFAVFFSFSALLAVTTRSTVGCVFGSVLFWVLCWGMNYGRHAVRTLPGLEGMPGSFFGLVEAGYWVLPKPADLGMWLFDTLHADAYFSSPLDARALLSGGLLNLDLSVLSSLLFAAGALAVAARHFATTDY